jgi:hypothetical protein
MIKPAVFGPSDPNSMDAHNLHAIQLVDTDGKQLDKGKYMVLWKKGNTSKANAKLIHAFRYRIW